MKIALLVVGRAGHLVAPAIEDYERRAARYWSLDVVEVKEEKARNSASYEQVRESESRSLLERVPTGCAVIALTRDGKSMSSGQLSAYLQDLAVQGKPGAAFLIGGALGLSRALIQKADRTLSISPMTLPHELARLILAEQLYRAGTIMRGEPYHKART